MSQGTPGVLGQVVNLLFLRCCRVDIIYLIGVTFLGFVRDMWDLTV